MKIIFIPEFHENFGIGHIMRLIALAQQFEVYNNCFIIGQKFEYLLSANLENYEMISIDNFEHNKVLSKIKKLKADIIVTDVLNQNKERLELIKNNCKVLVSYDDLARNYFPSDFVINGNLYSSELNYKCSSETELLLSCDYLSIRKQFLNKNYQNKKNVETILITTGGNDKFNLVPDIIKIVSSFKTIKEIKVVVGENFKNKRLIKDIALQNTKIQVLEKQTDLSKLMINSDIVITSGGSTVYEGCTMGVPLVIVSQVEEQNRIAKKLEEQNCAINCGVGINENKIISALKTLINNFKLRKKMSENSKNLVDGFGTNRIKNKIINKWEQICNE